jgi:hypothetical protein
MLAHDLLEPFARQATAPIMPDLVEPPARERPTVSAEIAGTRLTLVEGGAERLRLLLDMIDEARQSVRLLF